MLQLAGGLAAGTSLYYLFTSAALSQNTQAAIGLGIFGAYAAFCKEVLNLFNNHTTLFVPSSPFYAYLVLSFISIASLVIGAARIFESIDGILALCFGIYSSFIIRKIIKKITPDIVYY